MVGFLLCFKRWIFVDAGNLGLFCWSKSGWSFEFSYLKRSCGCIFAFKVTLVFKQQNQFFLSGSSGQLVTPWELSASCFGTSKSRRTGLPLSYQGSHKKPTQGDDLTHKVVPGSHRTQKEGTAGKTSEKYLEKKSCPISKLSRITFDPTHFSLNLSMGFPNEWDLRGELDRDRGGDTKRLLRPVDGFGLLDEKLESFF